MNMALVTSRDPVRLRPTRRNTVYAVGAGLWLTGVIWLILHYFMQRQTEFGTQPHPMEFWSRATHALFGFAAIWTLGLLWGAHVVGAWKVQRHRISGAVVFAILAWLIGTGFLLYYLSSDELISTVSLLHWTVGLVLPIPFLLHRFSRWMRPIQSGRRFVAPVEAQ
jgi:hypothetical protein